MQASTRIQRYLIADLIVIEAISILQQEFEYDRTKIDMVVVNAIFLTALLVLLIIISCYFWKTNKRFYQFFKDLDDNSFPNIINKMLLAFALLMILNLCVVQSMLIYCGEPPSFLTLYEDISSMIQTSGQHVFLLYQTLTFYYFADVNFETSEEEKETNLRACTINEFKEFLLEPDDSIVSSDGQTKTVDLSSWNIERVRKSIQTLDYLNWAWQCWDTASEDWV